MVFVSNPLRVTTIALMRLCPQDLLAVGRSEPEEDVIAPASNARSGSESVGVSETEAVVLVDSPALSC